MNRTCGIVHNAGRNDGSKVYLPLEEVRVHALILDVTARVTITQVYSNPDDVATSRAKYMFPVPASAAVCAFEARKSNGKIVLGKCMDKDRARERHEAAIQQGKFTGLLETVTDDIFTISVGSILAKETIEAKIVYVLTLLNDDNADEIRFQLPTHISERYGPQPSALDDAGRTSNSTRVRITVDIQTCGRLHSVVSPTHGAEMKETRYPTHRNRESRRRTTVSYKSKTYLEKDFLLIIHAEGLDSPRCFAEVSRSSSRQSLDTVAFQLTMVPKFDIPELPSQEYIFLVDRSGSMGGARMETAKQTLAILLKLLPSRGTRFNIISFGNTTRSFSPQSLPYEQGTMTRALEEVHRMYAFDEGTELLRAMRDVFQSRDKTIPTAVFVLTDGCVYASESNSILAVIDHNVHAASLNAPLRIFALGIGHGVSTDICEGMAKHGNGVCLFAVHEENILDKCARLFQAGKNQTIQNVVVDWGVPSDHLWSGSPKVDFASDHHSGGVRLRTPPSIQQSPPLIADLHAGTRQTICAILAVKNMSVPKEVVVRGQLSETGEELRLVIPIRLAYVADRDPNLPPIHSIAAWKLIQDHQEGWAPLPLATNPGLTDEVLRKAAIVRLGETYHVSSRYTSFVAVDEDDDDDAILSSGTLHAHTGDRYLRHSRSTQVNTQADVAEPAPLTSQGQSLVTRIGSFFKSWPFTNPLTLYLPSPNNRPGPRPRSQSPAPSNVSLDDNESTRTFSTLSSLESRSDYSDWSDGRPSSPPPLSEEDKRLYHSPSFVFQTQEATSTIAVKSTTVPIKMEVVNLIGLQGFDGSFHLGDEFVRLIGDEAINDIRGHGVEPALWATALAAAFLQKHATAHKELWVKAAEYLKARGAGDILVQATEALR